MRDLFVDELAQETALRMHDLQFEKKIGELTTALTRKDDVIAEKNDVIAEKDDVIAEKNDVITEKDAEIARLQRLLESYGIHA